MRPPGSVVVQDRSADIQDLYGHTRPETTMIYTSPELAKHLAAPERLRRDDAAGGPEPAAAGV